MYKTIYPFPTKVGIATQHIVKMYAIITLYGRNEEYIRNVPVRIFRYPRASETSHLDCPDCLFRNRDDLLLRIRIQLGQDKCTWRVGEMNEDVMEYYFRDILVTNIGIPCGQSMILSFVEELDNSIALFNTNWSNDTLFSQAPQVR